MLGEYTASLLPAWLAIGIALLPLGLFVFFRPEELPISVVRMAHIVAAIVYLSTVIVLFCALATAGQLSRGWQVLIPATAAGAIPCCIVLFKVMAGTYEPAQHKSSDLP